MLKKLSGIPHEVITGYAIFDRERDDALCDAVTTRVFFKPLRDEEIAAYIATGCPFDKAGAYAIQGGAATWWSGSTAPTQRSWAAAVRGGGSAQAPWCDHVRQNTSPQRHRENLKANLQDEQDTQDRTENIRLV